MLNRNPHHLEQFPAQTPPPRPPHNNHKPAAQHNNKPSPNPSSTSSSSSHPSSPLPEPLSPESATILLSNPPFTDFQSLLPHLGDLISSTLHTSAVSLARIANPTTNPSFLHRAVPGLQTTYHKLASDVSQSKLALARERLRAADTLTQCLDEHAAALTLLVRSLEAKHGVVARSLEFRAAETGLRRRGPRRMPWLRGRG
ncbi:uncharacterized protein N0V96_006610 [Colletotrichum fioriniae]|uniref:uncharacterized protein n=1 Tax=Colletotrichum fioriniae TaxID=710243 RepID=UPI0032DAC9E8|nr:hypothetical protein N0V96_006610 [Colletotrichum fioriniae]